MAESVAAALEGRQRLLVFDNCEHVLDAAADMIEVDPASIQTTVTVVATSREGLRLADEQLWPVPSLDVHTGSDSAGPTLFVERAGAVAPGISLIDAQDCVAEICRRLDGIPLAIELAASRMQSMTAIELRDRLDDRFRLLVGARRGLERHQTLRHAVQWSFDLLERCRKVLAHKVFSIRRRLRSGGRVRSHRVRRRRRHARSARRAGAEVASDRRPVVRSHPVLDARDDPPVRRGATRHDRCGRYSPHRACALLRWTRARRLVDMGQPAATRHLRVVHRRAGEPARRIPVGGRSR